MPHTATVELETTISDLREVSRKLKALLPDITEGSLREDLQQMQQQADAAIALLQFFASDGKPRAQHGDYSACCRSGDRAPEWCRVGSSRTSGRLTRRAVALGPSGVHSMRSIHIRRALMVRSQAW